MPGSRTEKAMPVALPSVTRRRPKDPRRGEYAALVAEAERRGLRGPTGQRRDKEQQAEWDRCASDALYFIRHYCYTYDPRVQKGDPYFLLDLFPKQEELIRWFLARLDGQEDGLVEKSRDSGISYCACAFALWLWLFRPGFSCGFGSYKLEKVDKKDDPDSLFVKLRLMIRRLPVWMIPVGWDEAACAPECRIINPENQSIITGEGGDDVGRGGRKTIYFVDEAAHLEHQELVDRSLSQTTNCRIYMSTPKGMDRFYRKRTRMPVFTFHWKDDPRKNHWEHPDGRKGQGWDAPTGAVYPWYEREKVRHEASDLAQEVDISYLGSGNPRYNREYLMTLVDNRPQPLRVETDPWFGTVTTYQDPLPFGRNRQGEWVSYVIVADVAEGFTATGDPDYSVAHVYRTDTWEQVCHYRGRPDTHNYAYDLYALGMQYHDRSMPALICILRRGPGLAVLETLMNQVDDGAGYSNLYFHQGIIGGQAQTRPGFPESQPINVQAEAELGSLIDAMARGEEGFVWNAPNTIEELIHLVRTETGRCEAEPGYHDDECAVCRAAAVVIPLNSMRARILPQAPPPAHVPYRVNGRRR